MALLHHHEGKLITSFQDTIIISDYVKCVSKSLTLPEDNKQASDKKEIVQDERYIISMCYSKTDNLFCLTTNKKQLILYDKDFNMISNFLLKRVASKIRFTPSNNIVVADKSGDVYLYKLKEHNDGKPELLLGHLSMLLDVLITPCEKYIITCDRDEKIRVSHYPNAYNIVTFCLGHKEFVTNIELCGESLVSASGDGTIKLWNYLKGEEVDSIDTNTFIDVNLKNKFTEEMDKENVEINALPIKSMQMGLVNSRFIIMTSLLNYNGLLVFEINKKVVHLQTIMFDAIIIAFAFDDFLVALTSNKTYSCYKDDNSKFVKKDCNFLNEISKEYNFDIVADNNNIFVLYKRKYDNVQEYLERKKQRLEGS